MKNGKRKTQAALVVFNTLAAGGEYWGDVNSSRLSAALQRCDVENDLYLVLLRGGEAERNREIIDTLIGRLAGGGYRVIFFSSFWQPWLREEVEKTCSGAEVVETGNMQGIRKLIEEKPEIGEALRMCFAAGGSPDKLFFEVNTDFIVIGEAGGATHAISDIVASGCDYNRPVIDNPRYSSLGESAAKFNGCAYCHAGNIRVEFPEELVAESLYIQATRLLEAMPGLKKLQLPFPQTFFGALPSVIERLKRDGARPFSFLVQLRADVLADRKDEIAIILEAMRGTGFRLYPSVIGLENFSEKELLILNRGYGPGKIRRAIKNLAVLKEKFGDALDLSKTVASFILFNPYTEMKDLKRNVSEMEHTDFGLFSDININRVRINPRTALYALAKKDGLVSERRYESALTDLPRGGYQDDYPWQFRDSRMTAPCNAYIEADIKHLAVNPEKTIYILKKIIEAF